MLLDFSTNLFRMLLSDMGGNMVHKTDVAKLQCTAPLYLWLVYVNKGIKRLHIPRYIISNLISNYKYPFSVTFANKI